MEGKDPPGSPSLQCPAGKIGVLPSISLTIPTARTQSFIGVAFISAKADRLEADLDTPFVGRSAQGIDGQRRGLSGPPASKRKNVGMPPLPSRSTKRDLPLALREKRLVRLGFGEERLRRRGYPGDGSPATPRPRPPAKTTSVAKSM